MQELKNIQFFRSFRHQSYRYLFVTLALSSVCMGMEDPLLSWVVLNLTGSSVVFGIVLSLRFAPNLIGPMTGVMADRFDRRKLLIIFYAVYVVNSLFLGTLIIGGQIQLWQIVLVVLSGSFINIFKGPAQTALIIDIVGKEDMTNALALNRIFMDLGVFGSLLVGVLVNGIGVGVFYYLNAAIYAASLIPLLMMRGVPKTQITQEKSVLKNVTEGFRYSWVHRSVFGGQLVYFTTNLFPISVRRALLFIFAKDVLHADASGLGWVSTATKLGDAVSTLVIAQRGNVRHKGRIVLLSCLAEGAMWILLATSTSFSLAVVYLMLMGVASAFTMTYAQIIIMLDTEPEMRGRVSGIQSLYIGSQFPGTIVAGALSEAWGNPLAVGLEGGLFVLSTLIIFTILPSLRRTD